MALNRNQRTPNGRRWNADQARQTLNMYGQRASVRLREAPPQDISRQPDSERVIRAHQRAYTEAMNQGGYRPLRGATINSWNYDELNTEFEATMTRIMEQREGRAQVQQEAVSEEREAASEQDRLERLRNVAGDYGIRHHYYYRELGGLGVGRRERTEEEVFFAEIDRIGRIEQRIQELQQQLDDAHQELGLPVNTRIYHHSRGDEMTIERRREMMRDRARRKLLDAIYGRSVPSELQAKLDFFKNQDEISEDRERKAEELSMLSAYRVNTNNLTKNELEDIL